MPNTTFDLIDSETLRLFHRVLLNRCPPARVKSSQTLATEEGRHKTTFEAGRHSVVEDIAAEISIRERKEEADGTED